MTKKEEVLNQIEKVFISPNNSRKLPTQLTVGKSHGDADNEVRELEQTISGRHWDKIEPAEIRHKSAAALLSLTSSALTYYMPLFLKCSLQFPDTGFSETILNIFLSDSDSFQTIPSDLTTQQKTAVRAALIHFLEEIWGELFPDELERGTKKIADKFL